MMNKFVRIIALVAIVALSACSKAKDEKKGGSGKSAPAASSAANAEFSAVAGTYVDAATAATYVIAADGSVSQTEGEASTVVATLSREGEYYRWTNAHMENEVPFTTLLRVAADETGNLEEVTVEKVTNEAGEESEKVTVVNTLVKQVPPAPAPEPTPAPELPTGPEAPSAPEVPSVPEQPAPAPAPAPELPEVPTPLIPEL